MNDVDRFIENFFQTHGGDVILEHAEIKKRYDPVKARAYYLRTRQLKGRKAGSEDPRSKVGYNGLPLKPLGSRMEEDETPETSKSGAKLTDYNGKGLGKATYSDGSVYDAKTGWTTKKASATATRAKRAADSKKKLALARNQADRVKNPAAKKLLLNRISKAEQRLQAAMSRGV